MTQVCGYDFTIHLAHNAWQLDVGSLIKELKQWAKKWAFQIEKCPTTDRLHIQGRMSLIKKLRRDELLAQCTFRADFRITCKTVHKGCNFNYVMKADTRVEGPWTDTEYEEPPVLTRQLVAFQEKVKYPWQEQIEQWCSEEDDRSIKLIHDVVF